MENQGESKYPKEQSLLVHGTHLHEWHTCTQEMQPLDWRPQLGAKAGMGASSPWYPGTQPGRPQGWGGGRGTLHRGTGQRGLMGEKITKAGGDEHTTVLPEGSTHSCR